MPSIHNFYILSLYPATLLNLLCGVGGIVIAGNLNYALYILLDLNFFEIFFIILKYSYWNHLMYFVSFISILAFLFS